MASNVKVKKFSRALPPNARRRVGRKDKESKNKKRKTFQSARVETLQDSPSSEDNSPLENQNEQSVQDSSDYSSQEEDQEGRRTVKPYGVLIQSLAADATYSAPPKKKRKIENAGSPRQELPANESGLDRIDDSEGADGSDIHDVSLDELKNAHNDPFTGHLNDLNDEKLSVRIKAVKQNQWSTQKFAKQPGWSQTLKVPLVPGVSNEVSAGVISKTQELSLKQKLKVPAMTIMPALDKFNGTLAFSIFDYRDVLFPCRTSENAVTLRKLACLHSVNHVLKTRDLVIRNNARFLSKAPDGDIECRDQGFTRPKVLILLPTRQSCVKYLEVMITLFQPEQQENKSRFQSSYAEGSPTSADKPADFRELFDGNDNDMFRIGLKFTRKTVKYFASFYNSDIILASPLGLRMVLGGTETGKQDSDFLSSIELFIMDQSEAIVMQNWEHLLHISERLNHQPKEAHGCDFSRVRSWYLDGNARYLRQTVMFSAFNFPALSRFSTQHMLNVTGKVNYTQEFEGAMVDRNLIVKQIFTRFEATNPATEPENRFKYFVTTVLPCLMKNAKGNAAYGQGSLIFMSSYADFVRIRNYLATSTTTQNISFASISEYSSIRDITRARSHFASGRHSVLLYTERAHHFRRYRLKGVKRVIMYSLPDNSIFYKEIVGGFLNDTIAAAQFERRDASVRALFSRLDIMKLERIVGTERYRSLLTANSGDRFEFTCTE